MKNNKTGQTQDIVYGRHAVLAVFDKEKGQIEKIWTQKGLHFPVKIIDNIRESVTMGAVVQYVDRRALDRLTEGANHQGIALRKSSATIYGLEEWLEKYNKPILSVLILDGIQDPGNLGAIFRTASSADINAIIMPKHASAPMGGAAMKASAGTLNSIPAIKVTNLRSAISLLKKAGFYTVGISEKARDNIIRMPEFDRLALVFGSEYRGIRPLVYRECDEVRSIPMIGPAKSLNVSSAVAIVLYERLRSGMVT
jgi:23S rRNA (guanosine2251-2'-O)-methyltransferase